MMNIFAKLRNGIRRTRLRRSLFRLCIGLLVIAGLFIGWILLQNDYAMQEQTITIPTSQGVLKGTLTLPPSYSGKLGLAVFVHGDGPVNASYDGGYEPVWEKLAAAGYASLSMSKPGIDGSTGNWLLQSMDDRASETSEVIDWAKQHLSMIDTSRIGLWGASQAGWVIPKVARLQSGLAFAIIVSPAINWMRQGAYNTVAQMHFEGYSDEDISTEQAEDKLVNQLLVKQGSYADYLKLNLPEHSISPDRWTFISKNFRSDATADLSNLYMPVHLILGGKDVNVDIRETEHVYRQVIPPSQLSVTIFPELNHSMMNEQLASSSWRTTLTAILLPRHLLDARYGQDMTQFLQQIRRES